MDLAIGDTFNTPFEKGCVVTEEPDERGQFLALDSDGVECSFHVKMVSLVGRDLS
jgi:hypothetical protein